MLGETHQAFERERVEEHYWSYNDLYEQYTPKVHYSNIDSIRSHGMGQSISEDSLSNGGTLGVECSSQDIYLHVDSLQKTVMVVGTSEEGTMCSCDCGRNDISLTPAFSPGFSKCHNVSKIYLPAKASLYSRCAGLISSIMENY